MTNFNENKALGDVFLSNGLIDIRFTLFPGTAMSSKKNATSIQVILYLYLIIPVISCFVGSFYQIYSCIWWHLVI